MRKRLPAVALGLALTVDPRIAVAQTSENANKPSKEIEEIHEPTLRQGSPQPEAGQPPRGGAGPRVRGKGCGGCAGCAISPCQAPKPPSYCKTEKQ